MMMEGLGIGRCPPLCETIGGRPVGPTAREVLGANKDPPSTSTRALGAGALRWENGHKEIFDATALCVRAGQVPMWGGSGVDQVAYAVGLRGDAEDE